MVSGKGAEMKKRGMAYHVGTMVMAFGLLTAAGALLVGSWLGVVIGLGSMGLGVIIRGFQG